MSRIGWNQTGTIQRKSEASDGYGGVTSTLANLVTGWRFRLWERNSVYAMKKTGREGAQVFSFSGESPASAVRRGDVLVVSTASYLILDVKVQLSEGGAVDHIAGEAEKIS